MHPEIKELTPRKLANRIKKEEARLDRMKQFADANPDLGPGWLLAVKSLGAELVEMKEYAAEKKKEK